MLGHAARSVPWLLFVATGLLLAALVEAVDEWPWQVWPLQGIAVGLLSATAMFAFDEPAAAVVDTLPRSLRWRTVARGTAVVLLVGWWLLLVALHRDAWFGHPWAVAGQGVAGALLATAAVTSLRRHGWSSPAGVASGLVVTVVVFVALARPLEEEVPVFPYTPDAPWTASAWLWGLAGLAAVVWLESALSERAWTGHRWPWSAALGVTGLSRSGWLPRPARPARAARPGQGRRAS